MLRRIILVLLLFGSLALGFYLWDQANTALNDGSTVKGVFHEGRSCSGNNACSSTPFVTFKTRNGSSVTFYPFDVDLAHQEFLAAFYDEAAYHDGQSVTVLYNPANPQQAFISSPTHLWLDPIFWFVLGACILLGTMFSSVRQDQKKPPMIRR